jgi:iron complex outermembrane receptor protein
VKFSSQDRFIVPGNGDDSGSARYEADHAGAGRGLACRRCPEPLRGHRQGFETPTFNELAYRPSGSGLNFDLRAAESRQWELGVKAEPLRDWRINAALFQAKTTDEIAVLSNTGGRSTFQNVATRAGAASRRRWPAAGPSPGRPMPRSPGSTPSTATTSSPAWPRPAPRTEHPRARQGNLMPGIPRFSAFAELAWKQPGPGGLESALDCATSARWPVDDRNTDFAAASTVPERAGDAGAALEPLDFKEFLRVDNLPTGNYVGVR